MSFWDDLKNTILNPIDSLKSAFKTTVSGIGTGPMGAAQGFAASQAGRTGAPSPIVSRVGQQQFVDVATPSAKLLAEFATPYRELIAEPFVASQFEGFGAAGREFIEGLPGDFGIEESEIAQYVSPGQALVRTLGRGYGAAFNKETAVSQVDFTDYKQVQDFFSKGAPKFWSGFADFGFTVGLDPFLLAGKGTQVARSSLIARTVKSEKDVINFSNEINAAVAEQPSPWLPTIDYIMSDEVTSSSDILTSNLFAEGTKQSDFADTLFAAKQLGREAVGDVLKAGIGNVKSINKIKSQFESARKAFQEAEKITAWVKAELEKPIVGGEFSIPSRTEYERILREANERMQKASIVDDNLSRILKGDYEAGTEFDGIWGTIRGKSVSKFQFLERAKVKNAGRATDSYWNVNEYKSPTGYVGRVASWLNRGNIQKEFPSTWLVTNESGSQTAFREVASNIRRAQKITKASPNWSKQKLSTWTSLTTKKERREFLQEFEDDTVYLMFKNLIPGTENFSPEQLGYLKALAKTLAGNYRQARYQTLADTLDNGYHVLDGSNNPIFLEGFEKFLNAFGETKASYRNQIAKELEGTPLLESDVPSVYTIMDFDIIKQIISDNPSRFALLVEKIAKGNLDDRGLRRQINEIAKSAEKKRVEPNVTSYTNALSRELLTIGDTFNTFWKPITLVGVRYALRNLFAGAIRVPATIDNLSYELGYKRFALYKEMLPSVKTATNAIDNILELKRVRTGKKEFNRKELQIRTGILESEDEIRIRTRNLNLALREARAKQKQLNIIKRSRVKDVDELLKMSIRQFPAKKQKEYEELMDKFIDESISDDEFLKVIDLFTEKMYSEEDITNFGKMFTFFNNALNKNLDEVEQILSTGNRKKAAEKAKRIVSYPITPIEIGLLDDIRQIYREILLHTQAIGAHQFDRGVGLDTLQTLAIGKTPEFKRVGTETFEVFDGLLTADYFAGVLGEFARRGASAGRTLRATLAENNRQTVVQLYKRRSSSVEIMPDNPDWAETFVHYFNTRLYNDELIQRIARGESDEDILKWLGDKSSKQYRKNAESGIKEWGRGDLRQFVKAVRLIAEKAMPDVDGLNLRDALKNGNLTPEMALRIPEELRTGVFGFEIYPHKETSLYGLYQRGVNAFFTYLGSLPEDIFLRNPLYRTIYRNETRFLGELAQKQGADITDGKVLASIARQAHFRANKVVTENLYTIERYTEPATFLRIASPFYMAQQNDAKFWLGEAIKNPRIPYLGILAWNSVNESMEVRDVDEYNRRAGKFTSPINSGEQIWVTLPSGVAKILGIPNMNILKLSKDSANLVLQGTIPLIPALGQPIQVGASELLKYLVGKDFDIDKELTSWGTTGEIIREYALGPQARGVEGLLPSNAWIQNARDYLFYEQSPRYHNRASLILEQKLLRAQEEEGLPVTSELIAKYSKEAYKEARKTFLYGIFLGFNSPVAGQLGSEFELMKSEWRLYTSPVESGGYGYEEGAIKFEQDYGKVMANYARTSLSYNPAGLLSTNETIRNINKNKQLFDTIFSKDKVVAGLMVNAGDRDDFSPLAHEKLSKIKVGGEPLRSRKENISDMETERQVNIGWDIYLAEAEKLEVRLKDAPQGVINAAKSMLKENVGKDYPLFFEKSGQDIDLNLIPRVTAINTVLNDETFSRSNQAKTPLWQALRIWAEERQELSDMLTQNGRKEADKVTEEIYKQTARNIAVDYPEFWPVFERYLSGDKLNKVQVRLK